MFATATLVADTINTAELANGPAVGTRADVICAPRAPCAAPRGAAVRPRAAACLAERGACAGPALRLFQTQTHHAPQHPRR